MKESILGMLEGLLVNAGLCLTMTTAVAQFVEKLKQLREEVDREYQEKSDKAFAAILQEELDDLYQAGELPDRAKVVAINGKDIDQWNKKE